MKLKVRKERGSCISWFLLSSDFTKDEAEKLIGKIGGNRIQEASSEDYSLPVHTISKGATEFIVRYWGNDE